MERKVEDCDQFEANGQCSKADSRSFSHDRASGNRCDGKIPSESTGRRGESPSRTRRRIPCRHCLGESVRTRHVIVGTLPCLNYKSESGCTFGECRSRHVGAARQPSKKSKKGGVK